ncbi:hypothetical protein CRENBAI_024689 [Crenichthys baileyi]|uniref:Uncharacterized protein n=1 Tax=Crenichthys baileyi TaxID=28760 RepID=A0AAV9RPK9_9TELE
MSLSMAWAKPFSLVPKHEIGQTVSRRDLKSAILDQRVIFGPFLLLLTSNFKNLVFAPSQKLAQSLKKHNNVPKETPNYTKVGMKDDLWVPNDPMGSYADTI